MIEALNHLAELTSIHPLPVLAIIALLLGVGYDIEQTNKTLDANPSTFEDNRITATSMRLLGRFWPLPKIAAAIAGAWWAAIEGQTMWLWPVALILFFVGRHNKGLRE